ncbi:MAG: hypothetical protein FJ306_05720 [Planctomycetes bacterium]|nr:hypothetical protein [Planctomycetota bacterium]
MNSSGRADSLLRQLTPLVLLGVIAAIVFERWLPGAAWIKAQLGEQAILRACIAVLTGYVLLLWGESIRLHTILTGVLAAFRQFDQQAAAAGAPPKGARNPKARIEAARLLVAALQAEDPSIRATSRHNLVRLAGQDLGDAPGPWLAWIDEQEAGGK